MRGSQFSCFFFLNHKLLFLVRYPVRNLVVSRHALIKIDHLALFGKVFIGLYTYQGRRVETGASRLKMSIDPTECLNWLALL